MRIAKMFITAVSCISHRVTMTERQKFTYNVTLDFFTISLILFEIGKHR